MSETIVNENCESRTEMDEFRKKLLDDLNNASPLDTFSILQNIELYDEKHANEIISQVNQEFNTGENKVKNIVVPVFTSVIDGVFEQLKIAKEMRNCGLTATSVVTQCMNFQYGSESNNAEILAEVTRNRTIDNVTTQEVYNINESVNAEYGSQIGEYTGNRSKYVYTPSQRQELLDNQKIDEKHIIDGYTGETIYTSKEYAMEAEGNISKSAQLEHIIPLATVHEQLSQNCLLTDADVKQIANSEDNFVFISQHLNGSKQDAPNSEYVEAHKDTLSETTQKNMVQKEKEAQRAINKEANKAVVRNALTEEGIKRLGDEFKSQSSAALKSSGKMGIGRAITELIKPLYYEVSDIFRNGMCEPVGVETVGEAFKFRMARVVYHITSILPSFGLGVLLDTIKNLISTIIRAIIDLFFGIVKTILTLVRRGFPVAVSAIKTLADKSKSPAERGDAAVKLIGSALISIFGAMLLDKLPDSLGVVKTILMCLLNGIGTLMFMMLMDKLDIFSVKENKRFERIHEIFEMRLEDITKRTETLHFESIDLLRKQKLRFNELVDGANEAIKANDSKKLTEYCRGIAQFFKVELEYSNSEEFCAWFDKQKQINFANA